MTTKTTTTIEREARKLADDVQRAWHRHGRAAAADVLAQGMDIAWIQRAMELLRAETLPALHEPVIDSALHRRMPDGVYVDAAIRRTAR